MCVKVKRFSSKPERFKGVTSSVLSHSILIVNAGSEIVVGILKDLQTGFR